MKTVFLIIAVWSLCLSAHAGLNKWVDADGKVHYSDTPPQDVKTQSIPIISGKGQTEAPATYSNKSYAEREAELRKSKQEKTKASEKAELQASESALKKQNCSSAQQNLRHMEEGTRVVTYDANGERSYLDDAAREQRMNEIRKSISENCN